MADVGKLYIRGAVSNSVGIALFLLIARGLGLELYVGVAAGIQYLVFALHGCPNRSEKFYDLSGSFTHLALVATSLTRETRARSPRQIFTALTATLWMTRLGTFLYSRILRDGKDARFDNIKPVWLAFMGAWTIQALWVSITELPVLLINDRDDTAPVTVVDYLGMLLWFAGFLIEAAADSEKMVFRDDPANKGKYITTGLWSYSRHPNYFGEIMMWCAQALVVSSAALQLGEWKLLWAWASPAFTALLLLRVSGVPMVEKAGMKKWGEDPAYIHYVKNTSCIVPWHPAGPAPEGDAKAKAS